MVLKEQLIQNLDDSNPRIGMLAHRMDRDLEIYPARTMCASFRFNQIYQEWQYAHEQLKIVILNMSPEKLEGQFVFPWGQTGTIKDMVIGPTE